MRHLPQRFTETREPVLPPPSADASSGQDGANLPKTGRLLTGGRVHMAARPAEESRVRIRTSTPDCSTCVILNPFPRSQACGREETQRVNSKGSGSAERLLFLMKACETTPKNSLWAPGYGCKHPAHGSVPEEAHPPPRPPRLSAEPPASSPRSRSGSCSRSLLSR